MAFRKYVELTDPATIRALSHPARAAILTHLHDRGPLTATEVSKLVAMSPSGCSYHLRTLAKLGFVDEERSDDGRERRWRAAVGGYGIPKSAQDSPEVLAAARLWGHRWVENHEKVLHSYLAAEEDIAPPWRKAATFYASTLHLTPEELISLGDRYLAMQDELVAREIGGGAPEGGRRVQLSFIAVPVVDGYGTAGEGRRAVRRPPPKTPRKTTQAPRKSPRKRG